MQKFMETIIYAIKAWVKNEYVRSTDEEVIDLLVQEDTLSAVTDSDGAILATEGSVILW